MRRKTLLLTCLLLFCSHLSLQLWAQTDQQCVVVETKAGQRMDYLLSEQPRIVHNDATVTLTTTNATVEFQTSEVAKVYVSTSIVTTLKDVKNNSDKVRISDDMVSLAGYSPSEKVSLYTIDGKLLAQYAADGQGRLVISLSQLRAGIYIIKTKQQSVKFTKK